MSRINQIFEYWQIPRGEATKILEDNYSDEFERDLRQVHRFLQALYPQDEVCRAWMSKPNGAFQGKQPIQLILIHGESGLKKIHDYLAGAVQS